MSLFEDRQDAEAYTAEELRASGERVRRARERVLQEPVAAEAARHLAATLDERVARKRAGKHFD